MFHITNNIFINNIYKHYLKILQRSHEPQNQRYKKACSSNLLSRLCIIKDAFENILKISLKNNLSHQMLLSNDHNDY